MFTPGYNTQDDLDEYEAMRLAALEVPAPPPPVMRTAAPPGGFGPAVDPNALPPEPPPPAMTPPGSFPAVAAPPGGFGQPGQGPQINQPPPPPPSAPAPNAMARVAQPAQQAAPMQRPAGPPSAVARVAAPVSAPSVEQVDVPGRETPWDGAMRQMPRNFQNALSSLTGNTAAIGRHNQQYQEGEDRRRYENARRSKAQGQNRFLRRQGQQDALEAQDRARKMGREDKADAISDEARDPNSQKNQLFRQTIQKEYPEVWKYFTPEQQARMTIADADAFGPSVEAEARRQEIATAAAAKETTRQDRLADQKEMVDYRLKRKGGGGGGGGAAVPGSGAADDPVEVRKALADTFGGEDKVPPAVKADLNLAASLKDSKKRAAAMSGVLNRAATMTYKDATQKRLEEGAERQQKVADFKEKKEFQGQMGAIREAKRVYGDIQAILNKPEHKGDVPGYGRATSFMPTAALSDDGQKMRSRVKNYASLLIQARSGKAATDAEREYLQGVLGAADGYGEAQLISEMKNMQRIHKETEADLRSTYPDAAAAFDQNRPESPGETVTDTVRLYRNGKPFDIPNAEVEEALNSGGFSRGR